MNIRILHILYTRHIFQLKSNYCVHIIGLLVSSL